MHIYHAIALRYVIGSSSIGLLQYQGPDGAWIWKRVREELGMSLAYRLDDMTNQFVDSRSSSIYARGDIRDYLDCLVSVTGMRK